jgi:tetratricopeptide (TPR) repeat protein
MLLSVRMEARRQLLSPLSPALALIGAVLFFGGGGGYGSLPWIGGAALVVAAVLVALYRLPGGALALAPLAALAAWCAISIAWSIEPDRSWDYANLALVYLAFALVGLFAGGRIEALATGLAALLGAVCIWALAGKALPWLYEDYGRIARLRGPVGYWNALALLGDIALPLGLWLALRRRVAGTLLVYGWIVAIALSFSRGGALVAALAVVAWIALSRKWVDAATTLVGAGLPAAAVIAIAFSLAGVTSDGQSHATRVRDGAWFALAVLAGAGVAALLARLPRPEPTQLLRRAALVLAGAAAVAALAVVAVHASSWWDSFTSPVAPEVSNTPDRFVQAGSNHRWVWWKEAWRGFRAHPAAGTGAGSFAFTNLRYRTTSLDTATEPHDLPLQFLSETGIVGALLFAAATLTLVVVGRRRTGAELALWLALPTYLVHGLLDIDWDFAAVTAPVLLVAGALAARPPYEERARSASLARALAAGGVALAVGVSLFSVWLGNRWNGQAEAALATPGHAVTLAKRARAVDPLAVEPLFSQALAEQALGNDARAHGLLVEATRVQPENAETWYTLGAFELQLGCARHALTRFERFYELNSQDPGGLALKDRALALVNSGKPRC